MDDFAARQAPADATSTTWNDSEGSHEVRIGDNGVFQPTSASEEAHAITLGWPVTVSAPTAATEPNKAANEPAESVAETAEKETD